MEDVKHDLEQTTRPLIQGLKAVLKKLLHVVLRGVKGLVSYTHKNYLNTSMKSIQEDGPTKEVITTGEPLTYEEMKFIAEKAEKAGITIGIKEMSPDADLSKRETDHFRKKNIKHDQKLQKFEKRLKKFQRSGFLKKNYEKKIVKQQSIIKNKNHDHKDQRYMIFCNKTYMKFMDDCLEEIKLARTEKMKHGDLEDINKDGVVDEKDIGDLKSQDIKMQASELTQTNHDYGDSLFSEFHHDYSTQRITKEEYCAMRESMFDLQCHAARTTADGTVLIAIKNEDLQDYMKFAPNKPVKEYGRHGGIKIQSIDDNEHLMELKVSSEYEWQQVKDKFTGCDYIASHEKDGSIKFIIREKDTEVLAAQAQKKTTTDSLLKEAEEMAKEQSEAVGLQPNGPDMSEGIRQVTEEMGDLREGMEQI